MSIKAPNIKSHFYVSLLKSIIRIGSCFLAIHSYSVTVLAIGFTIAEIIGIAEEIL